MEKSKSKLLGASYLRFLGDINYKANRIHYDPDIDEIRAICRSHENDYENRHCAESIQNLVSRESCNG